MSKTKRIALISLCLLTLSACSTERIVEKPVPVEVVRVERTPVPDDLLVRRQKSSIPAGTTYGQAMELWAKDRSTIDTLNGQLAGIDTLGGSDGTAGDTH